MLTGKDLNTSLQRFLTCRNSCFALWHPTWYVLWFLWICSQSSRTLCSTNRCVSTKNRSSRVINNGLGLGFVRPKKSSWVVMQQTSYDSALLEACTLQEAKTMVSSCFVQSFLHEWSLRVNANCGCCSTSAFQNVLRRTITRTITSIENRA